MKTPAKRFRVFDIEREVMFCKRDTLMECVIALQSNWSIYKTRVSEGGSPSLDFMIDDVQDDIEVNWVDLMEAWDEGERPEDLQMF